MNISPAKNWREKQERYRHLGGKGVLVSVTKISEGMGELPYWVGMVEMEDGERVMGKLVMYGGAKPKIGSRVVGVLRKLDEDGRSGLIEYGVKYQITK